MSRYQACYGAEVSVYGTVDFDSESDEVAIETAERLWESQDTPDENNELAPPIDLEPCWENGCFEPRIVSIVRHDDDSMAATGVVVAENIPLGSNTVSNTTDRELELYGALQWLIEDLSEAKECIDRETGEPLDCWRNGVKLLERHVELRNRELHPSIKANMAESDRL